MKIVLIGATGTIGRAVAERLQHHQVIAVANTGGDWQVDIESRASITALFERIGMVDAIISTAGAIAFAPLVELTNEQYALTVNSKILGNINLFQVGHSYLREGGSMTFTSGYLAQHPIPGSAAVSMVNAALDAFTKAAALELDGGRRINTVSPRFVKETMEMMGMDSSDGVTAADTAKAYQYAVEGVVTGQALDVLKCL